MRFGQLSAVGIAVAVLAATGVAGAPVKSEAKPRLLNPGEVVRAEDYPHSAVQDEEQGTAHIRLTLDPAGRVSACSIEKSAGSAVLDAISCRVFTERARFEPVASGAGTRVSVEKVTWSLGVPGRSRQGWFMRTTMTITAAGKVVSCRSASSEAPDTDCWAPEPFPAAAAAAYVEAVGHDPVRFVSESRFLPDGQVAEEHADVHPISRRAAKVVVTSDGKLEKCETIEANPPQAGDAVCREMRQDRFEQIADAPKATGVIWTWVYLEKIAERR